MSMQNSVPRTAKEKKYLQQLGDNIREVRKQRGYSQEELAYMVGFSRSYYTEIETGKRNISILNLIKIINALKADPNELFSFLRPR